jgi:hypothetical protein
LKGLAKGLGKRIWQMISQEQSTQQLLTNAIGQLGNLIGNEFELARTEISEKASLASRSLGLVGAGLVVLIPTLTLLFLAGAAVLINSGFSEPAAYFLMAVGGALLSAILIALGIRGLSGDALKPSVTLSQLQRDQVAIKEVLQ